MLELRSRRKVAGYEVISVRAGLVPISLQFRRSQGSSRRQARILTTPRGCVQYYVRADDTVNYAITALLWQGSYRLTGLASNADMITNEVVQFRHNACQ